MYGSSGLVYSVLHEMHETQAAAGMGWTHLCLYPTVFSTASACRAGSVAVLLLQCRFGHGQLQSVAQGETFFLYKNPYPQQFPLQPYIAKQI